MTITLDDLTGLSENQLRQMLPHSSIPADCISVMTSFDYQDIFHVIYEDDTNLHCLEFYTQQVITINRDEIDECIMTDDLIILH